MTDWEIEIMIELCELCELSHLHDIDFVCDKDFKKSYCEYLYHLMDIIKREKKKAAIETNKLCAECEGCLSCCDSARSVLKDLGIK